LEDVADDLKCAGEIVGVGVPEADDEAGLWVVRDPAVVVAADDDVAGAQARDRRVLVDTRREVGGDVQTGVARADSMEGAVDDLLGDERGREVVAFAVDLSRAAQVALEVAVGHEAMHRLLDDVVRLAVHQPAQVDRRPDECVGKHGVAEPQRR